MRKLLGLFFSMTVGAAIAQAPRLVFPVAHTDVIQSVQFSADGKYMVTASADNTAKLWAVQSGKLLNTLDGNFDELIKTAYSLNGKYIVTASKKNDVEIWNALSGENLQTLKGNTEKVLDMALSSDASFVATISMDGLIEIWDVASGKILNTINHTHKIYSISISPNTQFVAAAIGADKSVAVSNIKSGQLVYKVADNPHSISIMQFSEDGKYLVIGLENNTIQVVDASTGRLLYSFKDFTETITSIQIAGTHLLITTWDGNASLFNLSTGLLIRKFNGLSQMDKKCRLSPDGKLVLIPTYDQLSLYNSITGQQIRRFATTLKGISQAYFTPDGKTIVSVSEHEAINTWAVSTGQLINTFDVPAKKIWQSALSPTGQQLVSIAEYRTTTTDLKTGVTAFTLTDWAPHSCKPAYNPDGTIMAVPQYYYNGINLFDATGKLLKNFPAHTQSITSINWSTDGKLLVSSSWDKTAKVFDAVSGSELSTLKGHQSLLLMARFNAKADQVITASHDGTAKLWEAQAGKLIHSFQHKEYVLAADISADDSYVASGGFEQVVVLWDAKTGTRLQDLKGHAAPVRYVRFSPDGKQILSGSDDGKLIIWDVASRTLTRQVQLDGPLADVNFNANLLISGQGPQHTIYQWPALEKLANRLMVDSVDWVVTHHTGLFDASAGAMNKLYFVQGTDIVEFNQLKERYYEPGLWKKVMAQESLRNVTGMKAIALPPDIQVGMVDAAGYLPIQLMNRGGGIGEVNLFINGKEVIKDAREAGHNPDAAQATIRVFIGKHKSIVKGQENMIAVKAWNKDHWVQSRGQIVAWHSKEIEQYKPAVHILTCGVSDYTGNEIDLKFAAKDAHDVSLALQLGARKLFGVQRSFVYNLTTTQAPDFYPTKTNIIKAFEKIAAAAHPLDVFVMYVSGHGINYGGTEGDWYYLTQEAYTGSASAYQDPAIRSQTTLSSTELVELFKKVPALKQVLMLDACASGKVVDNLMAQKDIESSTLRALDRMRDRTGMHIITGCTADAVSYEASQYGQGILTYSLLEGMRGAALREDKFIDVVKLFQYAHDRVPQLAQGIGGIQSPQVFSPQGSQSFDIGVLTAEEKKSIPIARIRPVYIRSNFQDENEMEDVLGIGKLVDESLNEVSAKGSDAALIFVDVREYPDACKLIGRYRKENNTITLKLRKKCGGEDKLYDLKATDINGLKAEVIKVL